MRGPARPLLLSCALLAAGCASYTEVTEEARAAYYAGDYAKSLALWNELIDEGARGDDAPLLLLERGMVQLAAGDWSAAARDLYAADQRLEILDFTGDPGEAGRYLFSEDSGLYRGPPHEKILAPTLISLAHAAAGNHADARTAANAAYSQTVRFAQLEPRAQFPSALVEILIGIWAEQSGDTQRACAAYQAAYDRQRIASLEPVLLRLYAHNAQRFGGHWVARFEEVRRRLGEPRPLAAGEGELIVVVLNGRAPIRVGSTVELSESQRGYLVHQSTMQIRSQDPQADLNAAQAQLGRQHDLPMAVLSARPSRFTHAVARLAGGTPLELEEVLDVGAQVFAWDSVTAGARQGAALSRLAVRLAVRVGTYLAVKNQTDDPLAAFFASAIAGAALEAADTPDTRCWTLLPRHVLFQRSELPAGRHHVEVVMRGGGEQVLERDVDVAAGSVGFAVFVVPD